MVFVFIELIWYIILIDFSDFKTTLHSWDISHSAVVCNPFCFAGFHLRILTVLLLELHISLWLFHSPFLLPGKTNELLWSWSEDKRCGNFSCFRSWTHRGGELGTAASDLLSLSSQDWDLCFTNELGKSDLPSIHSKLHLNRPWVRVEEENSHLLATYVPDLSSATGVWGLAEKCCYFASPGNKAFLLGAVGNGSPVFLALSIWSGISVSVNGERKKEGVVLGQVSETQLLLPNCSTFSWEVFFFSVCS